MKLFERSQALTGIHYLLYAYNGLVVFLLAGFMSLTQWKINQSMTARSFLDSLAAVPWPATYIFCSALLAFACLFLLSWLYRGPVHARVWRYMIIALEIIACICVMRSINMAYDGVVLLVVADLVCAYQGRQQRIILLTAMLGLYMIANYNLAALQMKVVPLSAYMAYYAADIQGWLWAVSNLVTSLNLIIFVFYMTMLVQSQHREKERIQSLNRQLGQANMQLNEANEKLRVYAVEVEHMAETRERNRLAREIHDTLGHALTGIMAGIDACLATIDAAPEFTKQQLPKIREAAKHGITDVRRSVRKLRPDDLERLSPQQALEQMVASFAAASGMEILFQRLEWPLNLREDEAEVIYRVVQEGITNANRHGHASRVTVDIHEEEERLNILIRDNGIGCQEIDAGFGLRHMKERLALLKGSLKCTGSEGFTIEASIPLNRGGALS